jgi:hypothetical protein
MAALITMELDYQELMLNALREVCPSLGRFSDKQLISKYGKDKMEEALSLLIDYVVISCGRNLNKNETFVLYVRVIKCLADYIKSALGIPVTLNTLLGNFHLLEYAVDVAFPGYSSAGYLGAIIAPRNLHVAQFEKAS